MNKINFEVLPSPKCAFIYTTTVFFLFNFYLFTVWYKFYIHINLSRMKKFCVIQVHNLLYYCNFSIVFCTILYNVNYIIFYLFLSMCIVQP